MQSREDAPRSRRLASPRGGKRPKKIHKPTVSAFFTGPEELKDTAHSAALLAQLKSFYDARQLCDVTIEVVTPGSGPGTGRLFPCNRNVLAAACPYFKSMFTGGMYRDPCTMWDAESNSRCWSTTATRVVCPLSEANVERLYAASESTAGVCAGKPLCLLLKPDVLTLTNCTASSSLQTPLCHPSCDPRPAYVAQNFSSSAHMGSIREETLADLTLAQLLLSLRLDSLDVARLSSTVAGWTAAPKSGVPVLQKSSSACAGCTFTEEDQDYLEGLLTKPIVKKYWALQMRYGDLSGASANSSSSSSSSNSLVSAAENPPQRLGMCAKEMGDLLWTPQDPFLCCSILGGTFTKCRHLLTCLARLLCREDPITGVKLKEVECYNVKRNQWALVAPLPHSFLSFDLMVIRDYLYALNSKRMFCYDPSHNMWLKCVSLKRNDFQEACVFNEEIYCICDIPVMKVYNPVRAEWRQMNNIPLVSETNNYRIIKHGQKLLLITSRTPQWKKNRVTVYEYDIRGDQWINIGTTLGLLQFDSNFFCLSARVYPSCLEPGQSFLTEEEEIPSESSTEWDLGGFSEPDSESGSSSSLSDDDFWVRVAPQ
uniref:Kelch repeat and BTB domain containing 6 n=1 Tax=Rhinopithecus bieti TaxID=61621 RepID=A0A2K6LTL5_RHIBE